MPLVPQIEDNAPWKRRFRAHSILSSQVAADNPERGLAVSNQDGVYQLYAWDVPACKLSQITSAPQGVLSGGISPDGSYIYFFDEADGAEVGHFVRVPFAGGTAERLATGLPAHTSSGGVALSRSGNCVAYTAVLQDGFHLYVHPIDVAGTVDTARHLHHSERFSFGPVLSGGGEIAVQASTEWSGTLSYGLLALDILQGIHIGQLYDGPGTTITPVAFSSIPGDLRLAAYADISGANRPLIWNLRTGERADLSIDTLSGDVVPWAWSPDGHLLLLRQMHQAVQRLYLYNVATAEMRSLGSGEGTYRGAGFLSDEEVIAQWQDESHAPRAVAIDTGTGTRRRTLLAAQDVPAGHAFRSVHFPSSHGATIQAWLATPEGEGPFPAILHTHGGPQAVALAEFLPDLQAWVDHGYTVISVNYRGSTTFGKEFEQAIWGGPGRLEVDDMVAARAWMVEQRVADPDAVMLTGWSYGGYLTLQALGLFPGLWAGGMAGIAIADWTVQYEDSADSLRGYQVAFLGGTPDQRPDVYAVSSPITYVDRVTAPVLIIQGRHDTRTPARPIEQYEARMRALGKSIAVEWFDAGHTGSFAQAELGVTHMERMLRWAHDVLEAQRR